MTPRMIEFWERPRGEQLRLSLCEFKGQTLVDLRVWYTPASGGECAPTQKGVSIKPELIGELIGALETARSQLANEVRP